MQQTDTPFSRAAFARKVLAAEEEDGRDFFLKRWREVPLLDDQRCAATQKIGVIGAGMAGLYTGLILDSLGFTNYEILEANPTRVGGRVFTRYFSDDQKITIKKKWNYIDYGAMRFPGIEVMDRVIGPQPWALVNYLNKSNCKIKLLPYCLSHPKNLKYYNSTRRTVEEMGKMKDPLRFGVSNGGRLPDKYVERPCKELLDKAFEPFKAVMRKNFQAGFALLMKYDHLSARGYLSQHEGLPDPVIDYMELLDSGTGKYNQAFTEAVIDSFEFDAYPNVQWWCVEGGTSKLPEAMATVIGRDRLLLGKRVTKIEPQQLMIKPPPKKQLPLDPIICPLVRKVLVFVHGEGRPRAYDHVINTLPPRVLLKQVDTSACGFSSCKQAALERLGVCSSIKVGLQFRTRWWQEEHGKSQPMRGGQSSTDLSVRTIVYPSYGMSDKDAAGAMIASYTWARDTIRLRSMMGNMPRLLQQVLEDIAQVHGVSADFVKGEYTGQYYIHDWDHDQYSLGAFALFGPSQFRSLFPGLIATEMQGRYHTAGEMASAHHAWIVGALNSAWRCVFEILVASGEIEKILELRDKWGWVEEVESGQDIPYKLPKW